MTASVTVVLVLTACSGSEDTVSTVTVTTSEPVATTTGDAVVSEDAAVTNTEPTLATTTVPTTIGPSPTTTVPPPTDIPPVDSQAAAATSEILALPDVAEWVTSVRSVADRPGASCADIESTTPALGAELATQIIAIPEATLQEMLLNFDAVARAAATFCGQGDEEVASAEWADAVALAGFIDQRVASL